MIPSSTSILLVWMLVDPSTARVRTIYVGSFCILRARVEVRHAATQQLNRHWHGLIHRVLAILVEHRFNSSCVIVY